MRIGPRSPGRCSTLPSQAPVCSWYQTPTTAPSTSRAAPNRPTAQATVPSAVIATGRPSVRSITTAAPPKPTTRSTAP